MLQIEWKRKDKTKYGTCDKKILTPPSIRRCALFNELKKGIFLPPSPLYGPIVGATMTTFAIKMLYTPGSYVILVT